MYSRCMKQLTDKDKKETHVQGKQDLLKFSTLTMSWLSSRIRIIKTILILLSYGCVGYTDSILGINMGQFEIALQTSTKTTSWLASASFTGFALGNVLLAIPCQRMNLQLIYVTCLVMVSVCNMVIPHIVSSFIPLISLIFINGISGGMIQAASIARILILWGQESATFLQVLDFSYAIGSIIGPFVCQPFLVEVPSQNMTRNSTSSMCSESEGLSSTDLKLIYPYSIIAFTSFIVFLVSLLISLKHLKDQPHASRQQQALSGKSNENSEDTVDVLRTGKWKRYLMILLASLTYAFTNGMLNIESVFLTKYVSSSRFNLPSATGASMLGVSWIVHVVSVVIFIFVIRVIGVASSMTLGVITILLTNLVLVFSTTVFHFYSSILLWSCIICMSVGGSTFFGPLVAFMENHFPVSPQASSLYLIPNYIGNTVWPLIVGYYFDWNPDTVIYSMGFCAMISTLLVILIVFAGNKLFLNNQKRTINNN